MPLFVGLSKWYQSQFNNIQFLNHSHSVEVVDFYPKQIVCWHPSRRGISSSASSSLHILIPPRAAQQPVQWDPFEIPGQQQPFSVSYRPKRDPAERQEISLMIEGNLGVLFVCGFPWTSSASFLSSVRDDIHGHACWTNNNSKVNFLICQPPWNSSLLVLNVSASRLVSWHLFA